MIPLMLISALLIGFSERMFRNNIEGDALRFVQELQGDFDQLHNYYEEALTLLSKDALVETLLENQRASEEDLRHFYEKMYLLFSGRSNHLSLYLLGMDGETLFSSGPLPRHYNTKHYSNWGVLRKALSTPMEVVFHGVDPRERHYQNKVMTAAIGITLSDTLQGVLLLDVGREEFQQIVQAKAQGTFMDVVILSDIGNVLYSKNRLVEEGKPLQREGSYDGVLKSGQYQVMKEDRDLHGVFTSSGRYPFQVLTYASLDEVKSNATYLLRILFYVGIFTLIISLWVAYMLSKSVSKPVLDLVQYFKKLETGDFSGHIDVQRTDEIGELMIRYNKMTKRLDRLIKNMIESKDRLKKSEMKMLQSQINPHFLYNTLDTIKWMAKMGETEAVAELISNLGQLLRISLDDGEEFQSVQYTLQWLENYLAIQKARYDEDLTYEIQVEEQLLHRKIPKLILQPLVENAILHGIEGKGHVSIEGSLSGQKMVFTVTDNGRGFQEPLDIQAMSKEEAKGIGLANVHRRIELLYGKGHGLRIQSNPGQGAEVKVILGGQSL